MLLLTKTKTRDRRGGRFEPVCPLVCTEIAAVLAPFQGELLPMRIVWRREYRMTFFIHEFGYLETELSARCCELGRYSTFDDIQSTLGAKVALCHGRCFAFQPPVTAIEAETSQNVKPLCRRCRCLTTMENHSWQTTQWRNGRLGPISAGVSRCPISAQQSRAAGRCDVVMLIMYEGANLTLSRADKKFMQIRRYHRTKKLRDIA